MNSHSETEADVRLKEERLLVSKKTKEIRDLKEKLNSKSYN